jgi:hypothetical protein
MINMDVVLEEIKKIDPELNAEMWHTGGGCMTIYVGTPDEDGMYPVAAGPGFRRDGQNVAHFDDFCYGEDGDGVFEYVQSGSDADIARRIYSFYEYMNMHKEA